jgi:RNA polymerase sigma factor (sigma-70 family)
MTAATVMRHARLDAASDEDLLARVAGGDRDALGELYRRHRGVVRGFVLGRIARGDDADDVVQETFLRAAKQAGDYRAANGHPVPQWLCYLAGGTLIDYGRREVHPYLAAARGAREQLRRPVTESAEAREATPLSQRVQAALGKLTPGERRAIQLRYIDGLGPEQAAEIIGVRKRSLHRRVMVGRQKLAAELADLAPQSRSPLQDLPRREAITRALAATGDDVPAAAAWLRQQGVQASESNLYRYRQMIHAGEPPPGERAQPRRSMRPAYPAYTPPDHITAAASALDRARAASIDYRTRFGHLPTRREVMSAVGVSESTATRALRQLKAHPAARQLGSAEADESRIDTRPAASNDRTGITRSTHGASPTRVRPRTSSPSTWLRRTVSTQPARTGSACKPARRSSQPASRSSTTHAPPPERPVELTVFSEVAEGTFDVLDTGKRRTAADVLAIEGEKNSTMLATMVRTVWLYRNRADLNWSGGAAAVTNHQIVQTLDEHPKPRDFLGVGEQIATATGMIKSAAATPANTSPSTSRPSTPGTPASRYPNCGSPPARACPASPQPAELGLTTGPRNAATPHSGHDDVDLVTFKACGVFNARRTASRCAARPLVERSCSVRREEPASPARRLPTLAECDRPPGRDPIAEFLAGLFLSGHFGHPQVRDGELELAHVEYVGAGLLGARRPDRSCLVSVAFHRFVAVVGHRGDGAARTPVHHEACAAEALELLDRGQRGHPEDVDGVVHLSWIHFDPGGPDARSLLRLVVAVQDRDLPLVHLSAAAEEFSGPVTNRPNLLGACVHGRGGLPGACGDAASRFSIDQQ